VYKKNVAIINNIKIDKATSITCAVTLAHVQYCDATVGGRSVENNSAYRQ